MRVPGIIAILFATVVHSLEIFRRDDVDEPNSSGWHCNTPDPTLDDIAESERVVSAWMKKSKTSRQSNIIVPTFFHVITNGLDGALTDDVINQSINVLNDAFAENFKFHLEGNTTTDKNTWYKYDVYSSEMKQALSQGGCNTLNIYSTSGYGYLGQSSLPINCKFNQESDGVIINSDTKPGGNKFPFNEGKTLVHEVGHWLGLYHTFQNGCSPPGDSVDDTPAHKGSDMNCIAADTCPLSPGTNPIDNFMNYTPDFCMTKFTTGQFDLMSAMWNKHRAFDGAIPSLKESMVPTTMPPTTTPSSVWSLPPSPDCTNIHLEIKTDNFPTETSWNITDLSSNVIYSGGAYAENTIYSEDHCVDSRKCYIFNIFYSLGDGICCMRGTGYYSIYYDGKLISEGGEYFNLQNSSPFGHECSTTSILPLPTASTTQSSQSNASRLVTVMLAQAIMALVVAT